MPKKTPERLTLLNLKGDKKEKDFLEEVCRKSGMTLAELTRRSIAAYVSRKNFGKLPPDWIAD